VSNLCHETPAEEGRDEDFLTSPDLTDPAKRPSKNSYTDVIPWRPTGRILWVTHDPRRRRKGRGMDEGVSQEDRGGEDPPHHRGRQIRLSGTEGSLIVLKVDTALTRVAAESFSVGGVGQIQHTSQSSIWPRSGATPAHRPARRHHLERRARKCLCPALSSFAALL